MKYVPKSSLWQTTLLLSLLTQLRQVVCSSPQGKHTWPYCLYGLPQACVFHFGWDRNQVQNLICSNCCSLPSGCLALRGITMMRADVGKICLPPMQVVWFIRMADWQMLMVCMYAHTVLHNMQYTSISSGVFFIRWRPQPMLWLCVCVLVCVGYDLLANNCALLLNLQLCCSSSNWSS